MIKEVRKVDFTFEMDFRFLKSTIRAKYKPYLIERRRGDEGKRRLKAIGGVADNIKVVVMVTVTVTVTVAKEGEDAQRELM